RGLRASHHARPDRPMGAGGTGAAMTPGWSRLGRASAGRGGARPAVPGSGADLGGTRSPFDRMRPPRSRRLKRHSPLRPAPAVPVVRRGRAPRSRGGATPRGPGLPKAIRVDPPSTGVDRATRLTTEPIPREIAGTMTGLPRGLGRGTRGRGIVVRYRPAPGRA